MRTSVAAIVVVGMVSGCQYGPYQFTCTDNAACGAGGTCEVNGFCSFPDTTCPSGRRFGDLGGPSAGQCVGSQSDGSLSDAGQFCYGSASPYTPICFAAPPTGTLTVSMQTTFDTVTGTLMGTSLTCATPISGGIGDCVIAAGTITINAPLRATGMKPLVLVAASSISVPMSGSIDVGSHRDQIPETGAGAVFGGCIYGNPPANSGGGAGGSFMGSGGTGGGGAGAGGSPGPSTIAPTVLRGGCPGQDSHGPVAAKGGRGGGAVFLIARAEIDIDGLIDASGEGGAGGETLAGGGGGGAGGMIGFDAPRIMATATSLILADGGGPRRIACTRSPGRHAPQPPTARAGRA